MSTLVGILVSLTIASPPSPEQARADYIRNNYSKFEARIPMRDGVKLFTSIYVPNAPKTPAPILLKRTPYSVGPYGADRYKRVLGGHEDMDRAGFIWVFQDVRGRFMSEGTFVNMRPHVAKKRGKTDVDESTDTYDTIEWLLNNVPGHNGRVGMRGISYPGFYCSAGAIDSHPALKAVVPQAPIADWFFDDMHHHGAFILPLSFRFFSVFGNAREGLTTQWPERFDFPTRDGYDFYLSMGPLSTVEREHFRGKIAFWTEMARHPNYDAFWQSRNILPHLKNIDAAVLVIGGWYDAEDLYGPLETYRSMERLNRKADIRLVMGPWSHGGWVRTPGRKMGGHDFGFSTSEYYRKHIELPFLEHHLKNGGKGKLHLPEALMFETGANRWRHFDAWPPKSATEAALYLREGGTLEWAAGPNAGGDAFVSDPAKPVPFSQYNGVRMSKQYPGEDQRFASRRPDVLVYRSEILTEDVTIAGPLHAELFVSTDKSAADWIVKLVDVQPGKPVGAKGRASGVGPGGEHLLVRGEVIRGRFRDSYEHPKPFTPNEVTRVAWKISDVLHTFKKGHRIMVHVQSTWFPMVDRNPQKYVDNIFEAKAEDFVKATHTVHHGPGQASRIRFVRVPQTLK